VTEEHLHLLKSSVDEVVLLEMKDGERFAAQILFVFDEGETPDVFCRKGEPGPDGAFVPQGGSGYSFLLSDIAGVYRLET
jgi:hypothetical protein